MKRYGLDPENMHFCRHCTHLVYDIEKGYVCRPHPDVDMSGTLIIQVNDCPDWQSPYVSTPGTTPTYERRINKKHKPI